MKLENFTSGTYTKHDGYKSFLPATINNTWEWEDPKINVLLEKASAELGGLNSFSDLIPNIDVYIKMHIYTEANKSSKIEGTKTSIEEDFLSVEDIAPEKRDDHEEVQNYIKALNYGINRIVEEDFPLCNRSICEVHEILMQGVRGKHKTPGEFRKSQNWIGGSRPDNAAYVPPHVMHLPDLLSDFEKFIHNEDINVPHLIKIAMLHYQFESIHPFLDGNGRIGRLFIPLYLLDKKVLDKPCFYISDYLEKNREAYYEALDRVRLKSDISHWIRFFLEAIIDTAKNAKIKFKKVVALVEEYKNQISTFTGKFTNNKAVLESFLDEPFQNTKTIQQKTGLSQPAVDRIIKQMVANKILIETTGHNRNRMFLLYKYFFIFAGVPFEDNENNV